MVVFPTTLDRYGAPGDDPLTRAPVTNEVRMHAAYLPETIRNATCTGFVGGPDVKLQQLVLSSASLAQPLRIGKLDRSGEDVNEEAVRLHLGEYLGCLGTIADTLQHLWCFENCPAGKHFTVRYQVTRASHPELHFWARGHNATLDAEEQTFVTSPALMGDGTGVWEIDFTSVTAGNVGLEIGYDFREPHRGMIVDQIEVLER